MSVPPPTTFAEGQRKLYGIAVAISGLAFGIAVLIGGMLVLFLNWGAAQLPTQLRILAGLLIAGCINTTIVIVGLLVGGPVGRFNAKLSDGDKSMELGAEGNDARGN